MKNILLLITIIILFLLQACTTKKPEITVDRISRDINGKSVVYTSGITTRNFTWKFDNKNKLEVSKISETYNGEKAEIIAHILTEEGWIPYELVEYKILGEGDIRLKYEWTNSNWELMKLENISFKELGLKK